MPSQFQLVQSAHESPTDTEKGGGAAIDGQPAKLHHVRVDNSLMGAIERRVLLFLAARTPSPVTPDQLTALGVGGAFLTFMGFVASRYSPWFVLLVILG